MKQLVLLRKIVPNYWEYFIVDRPEGVARRWERIAHSSHLGLTDLNVRFADTYSFVDVTTHYRPEGHA